MYGVQCHGARAFVMLHKLLIEQHDAFYTEVPTGRMLSLADETYNEFPLGAFKITTYRSN